MILPACIFTRDLISRLQSDQWQRLDAHGRHWRSPGGEYEIAIRRTRRRETKAQRDLHDYQHLVARGEYEYNRDEMERLERAARRPKPK